MKELIDLKRVQRLSQGNTDIKVDLGQKVSKLYEETGEFADAIDIALDKELEWFNDNSKLMSDIMEEGCDSLNVLIDILFYLEIPVEDIEKLLVIDKTLNENEVERLVVKLSARGGEFAQAMLKRMGAKNVSASASTSNEVILYLSGNIISIILTIINDLNLGDEAFKAMFNKKLDKWESKVGMAKRGEI